jgi:hypothetical protein
MIHLGRYRSNKRIKLGAKVFEKKRNTFKVIERLSSSNQSVAQGLDGLDLLNDGVISLLDRGKLEVNLHDTSLSLRCKHGGQCVPQSTSRSISDNMNRIRLREGVDEDIEDHLILLTPRKVFWIDHGGRSTNSSVGIWKNLGMRLR